MNFHNFAKAVFQQFKSLQAADELYVTNVTSEELWQTYLSAFPAGSDPLYRVNTEHNCSCCRHFVRDVGAVVSISGGTLRSIWEGLPANVDPAYRTVAAALHNLVTSKPIAAVFRSSTTSVGAEVTRSQREGKLEVWHHFYADVAPKFVLKAADIGTHLSQLHGSQQVLARSLREIPVSAIDTVLDLIAQNSLYRGEQYKQSLQALRKAIAEQTEHTAWEQLHKPWAKTRNTAIGTLVVDIAEGVDLEVAVNKFERMVAPENYQRPTALVTPKMVEQARVKIAELGLTSALQRRYAVIDDLRINNVLFADRSTPLVTAPDPFAGVASRPQKLGKVEEIGIDDFLQNVLPTAKTLELLFDRAHTANLVSLVAPEQADAGQLFKWGNPFSWSYASGFTDAVKERVKAAGGNVTGDVCCRLAWDGKDDLDFHMWGPSGHIYFGDKRVGGGVLDVDANGGGGMMAEPVENIVYADAKKMVHGVYSLCVKNFSRRDGNRGFTVDVDLFGSRVVSYATDAHLSVGEAREVARLLVDSSGVKLQWAAEGSATGPVGKQVWGLTTGEFHKVKCVMHSPNFWDGEQELGNKHTFFMLEGCANPEEARGFFNEFLRSDLQEHRKVLELVGSKLKITPAEDQLSGVGFSSTLRNSVVCRVSGSFSRLLKINF